MHLLYITFGKDTANHVQAAFSICSFLTQEDKISSINIITDQPSFYTHLRTRVHIVAVNEQILQEWKGPHDFFWRIKIKGISLICEKYPGEAVIYLDTDTFLFRPADELQSALSAGRALMHVREGNLSAAHSKTEKTMWRQVKDKDFGGIQINADHGMWNAGVVASPNTRNNEEMQLALAICDAMCAAGVTRRLVEQFALGVALQHLYELLPAEPWIAHYWSHKEAWNVFINRFFMESWLHDYSMPQTITRFRQLDLSAVPVVHKTTNTNQRLRKIVDRFFPARGVSYLSNESGRGSGNTPSR